MSRPDNVVAQLAASLGSQTMSVQIVLRSADWTMVSGMDRAPHEGIDGLARDRALTPSPNTSMPPKDALL